MNYKNRVQDINTCHILINEIIKNETITFESTEISFAHLPRKGQNREMMLLKLNSQLIRGLAEVLKEVAALEANCDAETAASVEAHNATAGEVIVV